jgi:hypothetical protein
MIKSRRMRWVGHVAHMADSRGAYRVLVVGPERKRPLERPRHRWEYIIKMDLQEVE